MNVIEASFTPNHAKFFENYVNVEHTVLGKRLKPFSLLHILWLESIDSPLFSGGDVTLSDLEIAVLICSRSSSEEILKAMNVKGWVRTLSKRFWHWANKRINPAKEHDAFLAYYRDYASLPEYVSKKDGSITIEVMPGYLVQMALLIKNTGWTDEKVLNMSLGAIVWLNTAFRYLETGQTSIVSDQDRVNMIMLERLTKGAA